MTDAELLDLVEDEILTGGRQTSAENLREVLNQIIEDKQNLDGKDQPDGYCGLDSDGKIPSDNLGVASPSATGAFLNDDGSWKKVSRVTKLFSGDNVTTQFNYAHALGFVPSGVSVTPGSLRTAALFYVTFDGTNITINFVAAPTGGVNNLSFHIVIYE